MKRLLAIFLLFVLTTSCSSRIYSPLKANWEWPIRADRIYHFDLDKDGLDEIYACTYNEQQGVIVGLNKTGNMFLNHWTVEGYLGQSDYKRPEYVKFMWLGDLDDDTNLDILPGTQIRGGQVSMDILYRFERELETGLYVRNVRKWYYHEAQMMTSGLGINIDNDSAKELIVSSLDGNIYFISPDRVLLKTIDLNGSVWAIFSYDLENDGAPELVAGYFFGITAIKNSDRIWDFRTDERIFDIVVFRGNNGTLVVGASENALYCLDAQGIEKWRKENQDIKGIAKFDMDGDGLEEILILTNNEIHALSSEGEEKWIFELSEPANIIHSTSEEILISGNKLYSLSPNPDYLKNEQGLRYLEDAKEFYLEEKCDRAMQMAENAKELFLKVDNVDGLVECDRILIHCSPSPEETEEIKLAGEYFAIGNSYYTSNEFKKAKTYLEKALELYAKWNYRQETINCDLLLSEINKKLFVDGEANAREYYLKAVEALNSNELEDATVYANKALQIYLDMESEKGILNANELLSEISDKRNEKLAAGYLENSRNSIDKNDYGNASKYAEMAKVIYSSLEQTEKIEECNTILAMTKKYGEAEIYYQEAMNFFDSGKYTNSTNSAKQAENLFTELSYKEGIDKTNTLLEKLKSKETNMTMIYGGVILGVIIFIVIGFLMRKRFNLK